MNHQSTNRRRGLVVVLLAALSAPALAVLLAGTTTAADGKSSGTPVAKIKPIPFAYCGKPVTLDGSVSSVGEGIVYRWTVGGDPK
jgi:hypothetical protein